MSIDLGQKVKEGHPLAVVVPLLVFHLMLLSIQIQDPNGALLFRKWILATETPFLNSLSYVSSATRNVWQSYIWLRGAREENRQLHETVRQLTIQDSLVEQLRKENLRLRQLVTLKDTLPFQSIGAHVVSRTPNYMSNLIYLDRGYDDGIRNDSPVLSGTGIVGRTLLVSRHNTQVQLITNPDASIGVLLEGSRSPGVLKGTGDNLLELDYISNSEEVAVGERVLTSGLDGIFPKGLSVGRVVESRKGNSVFRMIRVQPDADMFRIEEVSVVLAPTQQTGTKDAVGPR